MRKKVYEFLFYLSCSFFFIASTAIADRQWEQRSIINGLCTVVNPRSMNYVVVDNGKILVRTGKLKSQFKVDTDIALIGLEPTGVSGKIAPILSKVALVFKGRQSELNAGKKVYYWLISGKSNTSNMYSAQIVLKSLPNGAEALSAHPPEYRGKLIYRYEWPTPNSQEFMLKCSFNDKQLYSI